MCWNTHVCCYKRCVWDEHKNIATSTVCVNKNGSHPLVTGCQIMWCWVSLNVCEYMRERIQKGRALCCLSPPLVLMQRNSSDVDSRKFSLCKRFLQYVCHNDNVWTDSICLNVGIIDITFIQSVWHGLRRKKITHFHPFFKNTFLLKLKLGNTSTCNHQTVLTQESTFSTGYFVLK